MDHIILCDTDDSVPTSSIRVGTIHQRSHFDEPGLHLIAVVAPDSPEYVAFSFLPTLLTDILRPTENIYESSQLTTLPTQYRSSSMFSIAFLTMACRVELCLSSKISLECYPPLPIQIVDFEKDNT